MTTNTKIINNNTYVITIIGKITTIETKELNNNLFNNIPDHITNIIFDMDNVEYISSSFLRTLLTLRIKYHDNNNLNLINCNESVYEVIKTTRFDTMMNVSKKEVVFNYSNASFKDVLKHKIEKYPNNIFINYLGIDYTWKDIDRYSQIIAHDLYLMGVKKYSHVGMIGTNSINYIYTFLAIQKLGGVAVLFNDKLTIDEINEECLIGDVDYMCIGNHNINNINNIIIKNIYDISDNINYLNRYNEYDNINNLHNNIILSDDPSLMIFSSGSTGKPKAVLMSSNNLLYNSIEQIDRFNLNKQDILCLTLPLFHIFGFKTGFVYSMVNNNKIIIPKDIHINTIINTIDEYKCSLLHLVPTLLIALVNNKAFDLNKLKTLRLSIIAGAAMSEYQLLNVLKQIPNLHIINLYGLSEINPLSYTRYDDTKEHLCNTVGIPSPGVDVKILNPNNNKIGEVLALGDHEFLCYYKLPIDSQAIDENGYIHTGDLGYIDDDGYLHLTGRIKDIIIRGGENILPQEITNVITEYENINEVLVLGIPDEFYGEIVVACLSLKDKNKEFDEALLNNYLKTKLALFKIPTKYLILDELPKLGNGKLDKERMKKMMKETMY